MYVSHLYDYKIMIKVYIIQTTYMKQKDKYIGIIVFIKSVRYVKTYKFCVKHVMT